MSSAPPRRRRRRWPLPLLLIVLVAGGAYLTTRGGTAAVAQFRTQPVTKGELVASVSATGTLSAVVTVEVGSQVSGQISRLLVDFNSEVKKGQTIANIDPATFEARVQQAEADVAVARASVETAKAEEQKARSAVTNAERNLTRTRDLAARGNAATKTLDDAVLASDQGRANLAAARAAIQQAEAQVLQREAALASAKTDLERAEILAPVDGVVVDRKVNIGQTVAASLQAPVLFQIAQDLREMQLEVSVDEADIGRVRDGMIVRFSVDAFPGRTFEGKVQQIRKAATTSNNVVTYTVIASAANPDQALLPGMTANVSIETDRKTDALKVPAAAIRFRPDASELEGAGGDGKAAGQVPAAATAPGAGSGDTTTRRRGGGPGGLDAGEDEPPLAPDQVAVFKVGPSGKAIRVVAQQSLSNGSEVELISDQLKEGDRIITGREGPVPQRQRGRGPL